MAPRQMDPLLLSLPQCSSPPLLFCAAHLRRTGSRVPADRTIDGEAFCRACFRGEPISPVQKLRRQSKTRRKTLQNSYHLSANPRPPRLRTDTPAVESLPGPMPTKQNHLAQRESSTDDIPASHRMSRLEVKLLNALQKLLLNEAKLLTAIHGYKVTGRKKKAATARREGRSQRTWQIPLQPASIAHHA
jgi:hypothetical protein